MEKHSRTPSSTLAAGNSKIFCLIATSILMYCLLRRGAGEKHTRIGSQQCATGCPLLTAHCHPHPHPCDPRKKSRGWPQAKSESLRETNKMETKTAAALLHMTSSRVEEQAGPTGPLIQPPGFVNEFSDYLDNLWGQPNKGENFPMINKRSEYPNTYVFYLHREKYTHFSSELLRK